MNKILKKEYAYYYISSTTQLNIEKRVMIHVNCCSEPCINFHFMSKILTLFYLLVFAVYVQIINV